MKDGIIPDAGIIYPVSGVDSVTYVKPTVTNANIIVGDFTYYAGEDFESRVTHHYDFYGDRLIIGKFCQIAADVEFVMNGANHQMNAATTFPFYIFDGWDEDAPPLSRLPCKGDTVIGNDVWIGENAVILPGVHIGDGAIIGRNSVIGSDVAPYTVVVGDPAREVRRRFDDELTALLLELRWWDKSVEEINALIPTLTDPDLAAVKAKLKAILGK